MVKLAIIGASYLQMPLIMKARQRGIETHVFAWKAGDVGEKAADFFYPISIIEREKILAKCREIGIHGICSIASDLAMFTVNYIADQMHLTGNPMPSVEVSTNKYKMRKCFIKNGDPSPWFKKINSIDELNELDLHYPVIVKPLDRSGSRGVTKLETSSGVSAAVSYAMNQGFEKSAIVEEFIEGQEYSAEFISWKGKHKFLVLTQKYTTGAPHFIEKAHMEPADIDDAMKERIIFIVSHALSSLGIQNGASHSEIKITKEGEVKLIEIGGRMGGDLIGSSLVELSTGYDFINAVIDTALGREPSFFIKKQHAYAAVRYVFSKKDLEHLALMKKENPEILIEEDVHGITEQEIEDSSTRFGYYLFSCSNRNIMNKYLP